MCYYGSGGVKHSLNFLSQVDNKWLKWIHIEAHKQRVHTWHGNLCHFQPFFSFETLRILQLQYCTAFSADIFPISNLPPSKEQLCSAGWRNEKWNECIFHSFQGGSKTKSVCIWQSANQTTAHCTVHTAHSLPSRQLHTSRFPCIFVALIFVVKHWQIQKPKYTNKSQLSLPSKPLHCNEIYQCTLPSTLHCSAHCTDCQTHNLPSRPMHTDCFSPLPFCSPDCFSWMGQRAKFQKMHKLSTIHRILKTIDHWPTKRGDK